LPLLFEFLLLILLPLPPISKLALPVLKVILCSRRCISEAPRHFPSAVCFRLLGFRLFVLVPESTAAVMLFTSFVSLVGF
jgi:hypothetical protein